MRRGAFPSSWDLSRWYGLAAMVGGALWAVQNILVSTVEQIRWTEGVFLVALLLVLAGVRFILASTHLRQDDRAFIIDRGSERLLPLSPYQRRREGK